VDKVYSEATDLQSEPSGELRISCPTAISQIAIGSIAAEFAKQNRRVRLALEVTNRTVDPVADRFDLVIRPTPSQLDDADVIARKIAVGEFLLVAAPAIAETLPRKLTQEALQRLPVVGFGINFGQQHWVLRNRSGETADFPVVPIYVSDNLFAIKAAAITGLGIAALPENLCREAISAAQLVRVFPDWAPPPMEFFALYPSRRGLAAAGRRFIEYMQQEMAITLSSTVP
jgi:DNA-binding transcriptional LysR family regulator